ncbi:hypothetical protein MPLA_670096 [Mesorhizobium sp. ORS 3359]|nr:hypothetical protein MPLA_670096 [Mesorhizobium sp. ORS 3359]
MRVAETEGQFNDTAARKVYRNDSVSIPGKNFDQGTPDPTRGARNDDNTSCLHVEDFSRAPLSDFSQSILSGKRCVALMQRVLAKASCGPGKTTQRSGSCPTSE